MTSNKPLGATPINSRGQTDLVLQAADRIGSYGPMIFEFGAARPLG